MAGARKDAESRVGDQAPHLEVMLDRLRLVVAGDDQYMCGDRSASTRSRYASSLTSEPT